MIPDEVAIKAEHLSKVYRIGVKEDIHDSIGSTIFNFLKRPMENYRKYSSLYKFNDININNCNKGNNCSDIVWALKNISFEVKKGEVIGIIGSNGAGKSTILKILCRITEPTNGFAKIHGRISSLLEVGTGFHPELTGRDNVYLNGIILGMTKKEVDKKFDDIVNFSGVEKFLDTPVKRYSSGMKVRLAFSVAAHLEPEILIIDEVLAVGDIRFQKKCINKMHEAGEKGRTVVFVSHNMEAINRLCERVILLDKGKILQDGPTRQVISTYMNDRSHLTAEYVWSDITEAPGNDIIRLTALRAKKENGGVADTIDISETIGIEMEYEVFKPDKSLMPVFNFRNQEGLLAFSSINPDPNWQNSPYKIGRYVSTAWIPGNLLSEGNMTVGVVFVNIESKKFLFGQKEVIAFQVIDRYDGHSARGNWSGKIPGVVRPLLKWTTQYTPR